MPREGPREFVAAKTPGSFGELPPDAPKETFNNDPAAILPSAEQLAMARKYEQQLAPLTFKDSVAPPAALRISPKDDAPSLLVDSAGQPISSAAAPTADQPVVVVPVAMSSARRRDRWAGAVVAVPAAKDGAAEVLLAVTPADNAAGADEARQPEVSSPSVAPDSQLAAAARALRPDRPAVLTEDDLRSAGARPDQPYRPAASNTDSPSRGQPVAVADPGKQITGGFGAVGDAQYFPLDGLEVRELINGLLSQLHERLKDDLRFTIATTYPRCKVKVEVVVEAFGMDHAVVVTAVAPPHEKTPIEIARARADEIVFVIVAERTEKVSADGDGYSTNQTRRDLGLEIPYKRQVGGQTFDRA